VVAEEPIGSEAKIFDQVDSEMATGELRSSQRSWILHDVDRDLPGDHRSGVRIPMVFEVGVFCNVWGKEDDGVLFTTFKDCVERE